MRILIVDDEPLVRTGLISTLSKLREEFGITEMTEASNGLKAMEILKEDTYDLIFTDIKMPQLGGIEFLKRISGAEYSAPIAVLSCYDDYSYVREAFRNNVLDYILKYDITIDILRDLLKKAEGQRDRPKGPASTKPAADKTAIDKTDCAARLRESLYTRAFCVRIHSPGKAMGPAGMESVLSSISACFGPKKRISRLPTSDTSFLLLVQAECREDFSGDPEALAPLVRDGDRTGSLPDVSIGMSQVCRGKAGIRDQVKEAEEALSRMFYSGPRCIHAYEKTGGTDRGNARDHEINTMKKAAIDRLMLRNASLTKESLARFLASCRTAFSIPQEEMRMDFLELFDLCRMYLLEDQDAGSQSAMQDLRKGIETAICLDSIAGIFDAFFQRVDKTALPLREGRDITTGIRRALSYIHVNYCSPRVSLAMVAEHLKYSSSYLSRQFKKETGTNLVTYINDLRLAEAVRLIKTGKFLVYEIAEMVGYNNYNYFSKLYKERFGTSPAKSERPSPQA